MTPLHWAARNGRTKITELLLSYGADINAKDKDGNTPPQLADKNNHADTAWILSEYQEAH